MPESSLFKWLQTFWAPVFTGVTTFYGIVKIVFFRFYPHYSIIPFLHMDGINEMALKAS